MITREKKDIIKIVSAILTTIILMTIFSIPILNIPSLGGLLFPGNGIWKVPGEIPVRELQSISGLNNDVTIIRDEWGVPHIYGSNESDVFFALGYCHAQDRLFQMDMFRRIARGKMAEILGFSALKDDKLNLAIGMEYWANLTLEKAYEMQDMGQIDFIPTVERYIEGINHYIDTHKNEMPLEYYLLNFEPQKFEPLDVISILKFVSLYYSWQYNDLYRYINYEAFNSVNPVWYSETHTPYLPYQIPVCPNYGEFPQSSFAESLQSEKNELLVEEISRFLSNIENIDFQKELIDSYCSKGSNNWVIDGIKSNTGAPILCNDQHWGWPIPTFLYETHVVSTDTNLNFYGYTVPGLSFPIVGYNQYLGWGATIFPADHLDWYYFNTDGDSNYIYNGSSVPYSYRNYEIKVKGQKPVAFTVKDTVHGPVLNTFLANEGVSNPFEDPNIILAPKYLPNSITYEFVAIYDMIHAKNRAEFDTASSNYASPPINMVYGDIYGNIAIRPTGAIPIRDDSKIPIGYYGNGSLPYNGSNGEGEWVDYAPFNELPNTLNPSQHYLVSANQIAAGPDYVQHFLHNDYAEGYRARRLNELLNYSEDISVSTMAGFQFDINSSMGKAFTPYFINATENYYGLSPPSQIDDVLEELNGWDYVMDKELSAPTIYRKWRDFFKSYTFDDEFSTYNALTKPRWSVLEYFMKENETSHWFDDINTGGTENRDDIILIALNATIEWLEDFYDDPDPHNWKWGDIHKLYFRSLTGLPSLNLGPYEGGGEGYTVNPSGISMNEKEVGYSYGGAAHRLIIDFSNLSNSRTCIAGGQRGLSNSKHYSDQLTELFLQGKHHLTYSGYSVNNFPDSLTESIIYFKPDGG